jgi:hypothetical protein
MYIKYSVEDIRKTTKINSNKIKKYDVTIIQGYSSFNGQADLRLNCTYYFLQKLNAFRINYLFGFRSWDNKKIIFKKNIKKIKYLLKNNNYFPKDDFVQEFQQKIINTKCCCFMAVGNTYITGKIQMAVLLDQKIITDLQEIKNVPFYDEK